jgi:hypothetical protein
MDGADAEGAEVADLDLPTRMLTAMKLAACSRTGLPTSSVCSFADLYPPKAAKKSHPAAAISPTSRSPTSRVRAALFVHQHWLPHTAPPSRAPRDSPPSQEPPKAVPACTPQRRLMTAACTDNAGARLPARLSRARQAAPAGAQELSENSSAPPNPRILSML